MHARFCPVLALVPLLGTGTGAALAPVPPPKGTWSQRFPEVAGRIKHFDVRMTSPDSRVRMRVLTEVTYFRPRDSRLYPPFLRALLADADPEIRGEAVHRLWEHHHFLKKEELPKSFNVHLHGVFEWQDPKQVARLRAAARLKGAEGGWAIHALGIVGDKDSVPFARALLASDNVFTRFSAAVALVQLGERKDGLAALHKLTDAHDDVSGFYRYRAAECLVRLGERNAIEVLIGQLESGARAGYADGPLEVLEDLTGRYFSTAAEWRKWWKTEGRKR